MCGNWSASCVVTRPVALLLDLGVSSSVNLRLLVLAVHDIHSRIDGQAVLVGSDADVDATWSGRIPRSTRIRVVLRSTHRCLDCGLICIPLVGAIVQLID